MKRIILCSVLVAMCLISETFATCNYEGKELKTDEKLTVTNDGSCAQITCNSDGSIVGQSCGVYHCSGKPIAPPEEDLSKPFPGCCPVLHCRE